MGKSFIHAVTEHPFDRDALFYAEVLLSFVGFSMSDNYTLIIQEGEVICGDVERHIAGQAVDPVQRHIAGLLGRTRLLSEELRLVIEQICEATMISFEKNLVRSRDQSRRISGHYHRDVENFGRR
jgi:hypothetical protein